MPTIIGVYDDEKNLSFEGRILETGLLCSWLLASALESTQTNQVENLSVYRKITRDRDQRVKNQYKQQHHFGKIYSTICRQNQPEDGALREILGNGIKMHAEKGNLVVFSFEETDRVKLWTFFGDSGDSLKAMTRARSVDAITRDPSFGKIKYLGYIPHHQTAQIKFDGSNAPRKLKIITEVDKPKDDVSPSQQIIQIPNEPLLLDSIASRKEHPSFTPRTKAVVVKPAPVTHSRRLPGGRNYEAAYCNNQGTLTGEPNVVAKAELNEPQKSVASRESLFTIYERRYATKTRDSIPPLMPPGSGIQYIGFSTIVALPSGEPSLTAGKNAVEKSSMDQRLVTAARHAFLVGEFLNVSDSSLDGGKRITVLQAKVLSFALKQDMKLPKLTASKEGLALVFIDAANNKDMEIFIGASGKYLHHMITHFDANPDSKIIYEVTGNGIGNRPVFALPLGNIDAGQTAGINFDVNGIPKLERGPNF